MRPRSRSSATGITCLLAVLCHSSLRAAAMAPRIHAVHKITPGAKLVISQGDITSWAGCAIVNAGGALSPQLGTRESGRRADAA
jgi:hypothetical protein